MSTVMCIVSHADDEVLGAGGTLARHSINEDDTHVFVLCGKCMRAKEQLEAGKISTGMLGLQSFNHWNLDDQKFDSYPFLEIVQEIERMIRQFEPEIVYTHHAGDLNLDHRITHQAVLTACRPVPGACVKHILGMEIASSTEWGIQAFTPQLYVDIAGEPQGRKLQALEAYKEEMRPYPHARSLRRIEAQSIVRGAESGLLLAEAFTVIRQIS